MALTTLFSLLFWWTLWQQRNHQAIPNPDIFQYVEDGNEYLSLRLPPSIHPPPLAPILITGLAKIITPYTVYHELAAAHFINITCAAISLVGVYLITQPFISPLSAFLLSVLVGTNQIYITYSLGVTSEIIYACLLSVTLFIYQKKHHVLSYFLLGSLFLLRYESVVIPCSILAIEYLYEPKKFRLSNAIIAFSPIILWLSVLNFHSSGTSIADNAYLVEIWQNLGKIPNLLSLQLLVEIITSEPSFYTDLKNFSIYAILGLAFYSATKKTSPSFIRITSLIFVFHLLFLFLFPNFNVRYYLPIIWVGYLILINHDSRIVSATIIVILLAYNIGRLDSPSLYNNPHEKLEYRLTASWLNSQNFPTRVKVLIYEPWILNYFVTNHQVEVVDIRETPLTSCQGNLACVSQIISSTSPHVNIRYFTRPDVKFNPKLNIFNTPIYIVTPSSANQSLASNDDQFTPKIHFMDSYSISSLDADKANYKLVTSVSSGSNWANIYEYVRAK